MDTAFLTHIGLSERQAHIYTTVLKRGSLLQSEIATLTNSNRTTLYKDIDVLLNQNFLTKTIQGKRIHYHATNPKNILRDLKTKSAQFEELLPDLLETYSRVGHKPTVTVHDGSDAMGRLLREVADTAHTIVSFSSPEKFLMSIPMRDARYFSNTTEKREVKVRGLHSDTAEARRIVASFTSPMIDVRPLPKGMTQPIECMLYDRKILFLSFEHQYAIVIESDDIYGFLKTLFDFFWKMTTKQ